MSRLIDVSLTISGDMLVWPGDPPVGIAPRLRLALGDPANVSEIRMGTHTGTHVDPPNHFVDGSHGIDRVPLETLFGPVLVADARHLDGPIEPAELEALAVPEGTERVLLRTANSELWRRVPVSFPETYACLTADAAMLVVERGIRLIGVDFLSVEQKGAPGHPAHHILLENGVMIVEGLDLGEVEPGPYTLACLPLKILDGDGGPARAMLIAD